MKLETKLKDRILRYDGACVIHPDDIAYFIYRGVSPNKIQSTCSDEQVDQFNNQVPDHEAIMLYDSKAPISVDLSWRVPEKYLKIDLIEYFSDLFHNQLSNLNYTDKQLEQAVFRIESELEQVELRGMTEFIQTIIYILDKFRETNQIWGVGRGSSCASYLLFLTGLHVVDSIIMEVDMDEFFHD